MSPIWQWIQQHPALTAFASLWLFDAIVITMPAPTAQSGLGYVWLYRALHLIASNLDKIAASRGCPKSLGGMELPAPSAIPPENSSASGDTKRA